MKLNDEDDEYEEKQLLNRLSEYSIKRSNDPIKSLLLDFYDSAKWVIFNYVYDELPLFAIDDDDVTLAHKQQGMGFRSRYVNFIGQYRNIRDAIISYFTDKFTSSCKFENHPLLIAFRSVIQCREIHIRRVKNNPANIRTKQGVGHNVRPLYAADTLKPLVFNGTGEQSHRWIIWTPLPSDKNEFALDPIDMNLKYTLWITAQQFMDDDKVDEANGVIVSQAMCSVLQFIHNIQHFEEYFYQHILRPLVQIDDENPQLKGSDLKWNEMWQKLAKEYATKSILQLPRKNHNATFLITRIAECRTLLMQIADFYHNNLVVNSSFI